MSPQSSSPSAEGVERNMKLTPIGLIYPFLRPLLFTPAEEGSYTSILAAASPKVRAEPEKYKGCYMIPVGKVPNPPMGASTIASRDPELAKELWATTEKFLAELEITI